MRKITAIVLSIMLIMTLAACGSTGTAGSASGQGAPSSGNGQTSAGAFPADQAAAGGGILPESSNEAVSGAGTDGGAQAAANIASEAGTDLASAGGTDFASAGGTDVAAAGGTDLASAAGTDLAAEKNDPASEIGISPEQLLKDIKGTYDELFKVLCESKYDKLWIDKCAAIVGEEMAPEWAEKLKSACTGTIYGEEAEEAYKDDPENGVFDCYFTEGVVQFIFDGEKISGIDRDKEEIFSHEYSYLQNISVSGGMDGYVYETSDDDAGEFRYFVIFPDTPATSYHIEFRYGSDLEDLAEYTKGSYAYWVAAGIPEDRDDELIENVVRLFAEENLAGMAREGGKVEIGTAEGLLQFAKSVCDGSKNGFADTTIELTADIDCSGIDWQPIGTMNMEDMTDMDCMFQGTLDGNGHTISNITYTSDQPVCGIGVIGVNLGEVKHLTVENVNIRCTNAQSMAIGGVVGYNMYGTIRDVTLTGDNSISGVNSVGGIAGGSTGKVRDCHVDGTEINVLGDNDFGDGPIVRGNTGQCGGLIIGGGFGGTIKRCNAKGTVIGDGSEPVSLGGIAGCLEMMDSVNDCTSDAQIVTKKGGHAIGGLCGSCGTHSDGKVAEETKGIVTTEYPGIIDNCDVTVKMDVPGATHVGGLVGTGIYYFGEETAFKITNCKVKADITGAVTPGAAAGRAENSVIESCETDCKLDGKELKEQIGSTTERYECSDH